MPQGGKRPGAGRKPMFEKSSSVTLKIADSVLAAITGNRNVFIRNAIAEKIERDKNRTIWTSDKE